MSTRRLMMQSPYIRDYSIYGNSVVNGDAIQGVGDYDADGVCKMPIVVTDKDGNATTYPCTIAAPLQGVGGVADTADYEAQGITRRFGVATLNFCFATANSYLDDKTPCLIVQFRQLSSVIKSGNWQKGACAEYEVGNGIKTANCFRFGAKNTWCYLYYIGEDFNDLDSANAYLDKHPIHIAYPLAADTFEPCVLPNLSAHKRNAVVTTDTQVQPSKVELQKTTSAAVPFCDSEGNQLRTTLPNGVVLRWQNIIDANNIAGRNGAVVLTKGDVCSADLRGGYGSYVGFTFSYKNVQSANSVMYTSAVMKSYNTTDVDEFAIVENGKTDYGCALYFESSYEYKKTELFGNLKKDSSYLNVVALGARDGILYAKEIVHYNITSMFELCPALLENIQTADDLNATIWSKADHTLGYTPYTAEPVAVVVKNGKLWVQ